ncbi:MAG: hypothetical protein U0930_20535 [Pirellulales bacterium]
MRFSPFFAGGTELVMVLDAVELVMEIEEAFNISIPNDRACRMLTVGDVYEYILEQTPDSSIESTACLTAASFYELRRHLRSLDLSQTDIRPKTKLEHAFPLKFRRNHWQKLGALMNVRFPSLSRPTWLSLFNCLLVSIVVMAAFLGFTQLSLLLGIFAAVGIGIGSAAILWYLTQSFAVYPSPNCSTIRDLVTNLVAINFNTLVTRYSTRNPTDVWNTLQLIVAEQLGVDRSAVHPHARFVQDLGAD